MADEERMVEQTVESPKEVAPQAPSASPDRSSELIAELTALRTYKLQREAEDQQKRANLRADEQRKLAEKGQIEELVKRYTEEVEVERKKTEEVVKRHKNGERTRELALALSGQQLVPGAAWQLTKLWEGEFDVIESGDGYRVVSKDLKSPADWVREKLASEEYAHFVKAEARGGGGAKGGQTRQPTTIEKALDHIQGRPVLTPEIMLEALKSRAGGEMVYHPGMGLKVVRN